jgi:hypothetical protein
MITPAELRAEAEKLRSMARNQREAAQYAEGPAYREEMRLADKHEAKAAALERQAAQLEKPHGS